MVYDARSVVLCSLILLPVVHICMYVCGASRECVARCIEQNYGGCVIPDLTRDAMYIIIVHIAK